MKTLINSFINKLCIKPLPTPKYKLSIVAIVKNEINYLVEWISYHKLIGFEHFYIADNSSNDGTKELLLKLQQIGIVTLVDWPLEKRAQMQWYNHAIKHYTQETQFMMFLDVDEFLMSKEPKTIRKIILSLLNQKDIGAIAINWRIMGSAGLQHATPDLVLKKFNMSSRRNRSINNHIKSIINPNAVDKMWAHSAELKDGYHYLLSNGAEVKFIVNSAISGRTESVEDTELTIHHYAVKSLEEFIENKKNKGRVNLGSDVQRDMSYFKNHDINDELFELPDNLLSQINRAIDGLNLRLEKK